MASELLEVLAAARAPENGRALACHAAASPNDAVAASVRSHLCPPRHVAPSPQEHSSPLPDPGPHAGAATCPVAPFATSRLHQSVRAMLAEKIFVARVTLAAASSAR